MVTLLLESEAGLSAGEQLAWIYERITLGWVLSSPSFFNSAKFAPTDVR